LSFSVSLSVEGVGGRFRADRVFGLAFQAHGLVSLDSRLESYQEEEEEDRVPDLLVVFDEG
jgi:hypothetical protein